MKKTPILSIVLTAFAAVLTILPASARERSVDDMLAIARQTLTTRTTHRAHAVTAQTPMRVLNLHQGLAVVGFDEGAFCLVGRDETAPALLGYSEDNYEDALQNPNFRQLVAYIDAQVEYCQQNGIAYAPNRVVGKHPEGYGPLMHCTYNQGYPYNLHCPEFNGSRTITGCVATAASMILQYWNEHYGLSLAGRGRKVYTCVISEDSIERRRLKISYDFKRNPIDSPNLLADYEGGKGNYRQLQAVAQLHAAMGVAACMGYGLSGSGAFNDVTCYSIDWHINGLRHRNVLQYGDMDTDVLKAAVCNEIDEERPVYFSGHTETSGHSFVIDGYDSEGLFHINLGWGGSGWYSAANDMASFNLSQTLDFIYASDEWKITDATPVDELKGTYLTADFDNPVVGEFQDSTWYCLYNVGRGLLPYSTTEKAGETRKYMDMAPYMPILDPAEEAAPLVFRFIPTSNGNVKRRHIQSGNGDFIGLLDASGSSAQNPKTRMGAPYFTFGEIADGYWWFRDKAGVTLDSPGVGGRLCGWGTYTPTDTTGNASWRILPVIVQTEEPVDTRAAMFDSTHVYQIKLADTDNYIYLGYGKMKPVAIYPDSVADNTHITLTYDGWGWHISDLAGHDMGLKSGSTYQLANDDSYRWDIEPTDQPGLYRISRGDGYLGARNTTTGAEVVHNKKATDANTLWQIIDLTPEPDAVQSVALDQQPRHPGVFTLSGQRTSRPQRGLYIIDGKKVIIK